MANKVAIIGAGLAGLSAGIYLQKEGIDTEIFELAPWAGGVCTAWVRQGYRFDGCIHWMVGTRPDSDLYNLYREVDALAEDTPIFNAPFIRHEFNGVMYEIPLQISEFTAFLHRVSPQDEEKIDTFCDEIQKMMVSKMAIKAPSDPSEMEQFMRDSMGFMQVMQKYADLTVEEFVKSFQSPIVRAILLALMPRNFSASALFMMLSHRMSGNAGYPLGGAFEVTQRVEAKYCSHGGVIHFNSKVEKIMVENGTATAVQTRGVTVPIQSVIVASDAYDALNNLLGGQYSHPQLDTMLKSTPLFTPLALISFGLDRRFELPLSVIYDLPEGIETAPGVICRSLALRAFDFDPSAAPENCSSVMVMVDAPLQYWKDLREHDLAEYNEQKKRLAISVLDAIDQRIPGFREAMKVVDVATPATYVHLANLYQASYEGFALTPETARIHICRTIPGIRNLALCGQWTTPGGGIYPAILSGKEAAEITLRIMEKSSNY